MNPIIVSAIITIVIELLKNCPEERKDKILERLKNPRGLDLFRFSARLRRHLNISPREWNDTAEPQVMDYVQQMQADLTDSDLDELIERSRS